MTDRHGESEASPRPPRVTDEQRVENIMADVEDIVRACALIVSRGRKAFFDNQDPTQRLAAKMLVIDLATACERLPGAYRDQRPDVPWHLIRGTRNNLAHNYQDTDYEIVWGVVERELPRIARELRQLR